MSFYFNRVETNKTLNYYLKLTNYMHMSQTIPLTTLILAAQIDALTTGLLLLEKRNDSAHTHD